MNHLRYDRVELLLQMARHFQINQADLKLGRLSIIGIERKCWMLIYDYLNDDDEFNAMLEREMETEYVSTSELAIATPCYPYLESDIDCMKELWLLYKHYQVLNNRNELVINDNTRKRDRHILSLLLKKEWYRSELKIARVFINRAVLSHLFLPIITYKESSACQSGDSLPF